MSVILLTSKFVLAIFMSVLIREDVSELHIKFQHVCRGSVLHHNEVIYMADEQYLAVNAPHY